VDIDSRVWAAAVYRAFKVAAGCGVAAAKGPLQARMIASVESGIRIFLKYRLGMESPMGSLAVL
jgi:hypothetical protein